MSGRRPGCGGVGPVVMVAALLLGGCGGGAVRSGRYTGALPACGLSAATLIQQNDKFAFTPGDGVLTIAGAVAADGHFTGELNTQPPNKPAFVLHVQGTIGDEGATVDYLTPRCHALATFVRVHPPLL
jgi:hypothetical protein